MDQYVLEENGLFVVDQYAAVLKKKPVRRVISKSEYRQEFFPIKGAPRGIEAIMGVFERSDKHVDIGITRGTFSIFDPETYVIPDDDLSEYTTLHVMARANDIGYALEMSNSIVSLFEPRKDLSLTRSKLEERALQYVGEISSFSTDHAMFEIYKRIRNTLDDIERLPNKLLRVGSIQNLFAQATSRHDNAKFASSGAKNVDIRFIHRYDGSHNHTEVMGLELGSIYVTGNNLRPGIYGVFLLSKQKKCPQHEKHYCDQASSYAGFLFNSDLMFIGGSVVDPIKLMTVRLFVNNLSPSTNCVGLQTMIDLQTSDWLNVLEETNKFSESGIFSGEKITEIQEISKMVYTAWQDYANS